MAKRENAAAVIPELPSDNIVAQLRGGDTIAIRDGKPIASDGSVVGTVVAPESNNKTPDLVLARPTHMATAMIEIPLVDVPDGGHVQRGFNFRLNHTQARKLKQLRVSLFAAGVTYHDGKLQRHIDRPHDVFGWVLEQLEIA